MQEKNVMHEIEVEDFSIFLDELSGTDKENGSWGFRGVASRTFDLIPTIGRRTLRRKHDANLEQMIFKRFRQEAIPHLSRLPDNPYYWLALARHHGLPTRLLDWSLSPLVAAFFATLPSGRRRGDGFAIYCYQSSYFDENDSLPEDPFNFDDEFVELHSHHYSPRMAAQRGFFTVHKFPERPFQHSTLIKYSFPEKIRKETRNQLDFYGINEASLFPGIDGIGAYWGWFYSIST